MFCYSEVHVHILNIFFFQCFIYIYIFWHHTCKYEELTNFYLYLLAQVSQLTNFSRIPVTSKVVVVGPPTMDDDTLL